MAQGYALRGSPGPCAWQGYGSNRTRRLAVCLDVQTGRLVAWQREHFGGAPLVAPLRRSFHAVAAADPQAERLYIALDNWPVHFHPDLRTALPPQLTLLPVPP